MEQKYNCKEVETRLAAKWAQAFSPKPETAKRPFSIFLTPPNASGPMHVGNALMIAIQDILARYHRAKGYPTLWVPGTDHGGYETQVTFEKELEKTGTDKASFGREELFQAIEKFVNENNSLIKEQIKSLGASVDWSRFRFTMDDRYLESVRQTFEKMVKDNLIYRRSYMVHYCPKCSTVLADIELKERVQTMPLYFVKFPFKSGSGFLSLGTKRPEFLFSIKNVLVHPKDPRYGNLIGQELLNPITGEPVAIVESKRKFDPEKPESYLSPFGPSYDRYDYEYTLRNSLSARNLIDWNGKMLERFPGLTPLEARQKEIAFLQENDLIEKIDESQSGADLLCKSGHVVENIIMLTWFLKIDDEKVPLRKNALAALKKERLIVLPRWREKGLIQWLEKMADWPISRQNVWGIRMPVWYDISKPENFMVWFADEKGERRFGNLKAFLDQGVPLETITSGLQRLYAETTDAWTLQKEPGKNYLPETDTFDTWFSSGQWANAVFGTPADFKYFYPADSIVIGHDLLRLSISRKILLSTYLTGRLPFRIVYLHRLLKGADGQKMSKSLGNAVPLEYYLDKYGADVTRMALISYTPLQEDFIFAADQLELFQDFAERLWKLGTVLHLAKDYDLENKPVLRPTLEDSNLWSDLNRLSATISADLDKYSFAFAQEKVAFFLLSMERFANRMQNRKDLEAAFATLWRVFKKYLTILHPFMPFMTEEIYSRLYDNARPLSQASWPDRN